VVVAVTVLDVSVCGVPSASVTTRRQWYFVPAVRPVTVCDVPAVAVITAANVPGEPATSGACHTR
jgi:hypothetical protein